MSMAVTIDEVGHQTLPSASEAGPAPKRIVVAYGFWIFLLSDIVMFSALFAAYAVLVRATAGGLAGAQLFNQRSVAIETACLLASSYTCGMMSLAIGSRHRAATYLFALVTFALGAAFLAPGVFPARRGPWAPCHGRSGLAGRDDDPDRSHGLSSQCDAAAAVLCP